MRHSAPSILQDVQTRLVLVESGKLTGYQANAVRHVLYPSLKDMGCFTIFVVSGIPEPNQASIRRSRTVSFSRSSHPDEQSMI